MPLVSPISLLVSLIILTIIYVYCIKPSILFILPSFSP